MFRWPKPTDSESATFYETSYREGNVTNLPDKEAVTRFVSYGFFGSEMDCSSHVEIVRRVCPGGRLLDYGASWGYAVHQFRSIGYDAIGFELSQSRARFAREHIGVSVFDSFDNLPNRSFDVIHTSHVLEHVANLRLAFGDFLRLLRSGGHLVIFVPNAGGKEARKLGVKWGPLIGEAHVNALTAEFFTRTLREHGFAANVLNEDADELCVIGRATLVP